jgi:hypothetical protein
VASSKKKLGIFAAYNFDIILDKETQLRESDKLSIIRGGNKELYDGVKEIVLQTRQQLEAFATVGMTVFSGFPYKYPNVRIPGFL